ncbi:MAG: LacI family DNA-binding transcriptional regulator, partial [Terrimicrobiaceae bacterium]
MSYTHNQAQSQKRQPNLADIAAKAEVSVTTVSRILAGKKLNTFPLTTIERVRSIAGELRYRPNRLVRGMQTGQTGLVGVVMSPQGSFYGAVLAGIHDELISEDRLPVVIWSEVDSPRGRGRSELEQIHSLVDLRVEGVILRPVFYEASDVYFQEILERKIPLVSVDRALPKANCGFVGSDDESGMAAILDHLKTLGHSRICFFGPDTAVSTGLHRLHSFRFLTSQDRTMAPVEYLLSHWNPTEEDALSCLGKVPKQSAIIAVNDSFAALIYQAAAIKKIRIPEDISVVGYGNLDFSPLMHPPLTTVDQHPYDIGVSAARSLHLRMMNPTERVSKILHPCDLVVREST